MVHENVKFILRSPMLEKRLFKHAKFHIVLFRDHFQTLSFQSFSCRYKVKTQRKVCRFYENDIKPHSRRGASNSRCVLVEEKHCFALVIFNWFPICFYYGLFTRCDLYHTILLYYYAETKKMIYESVNLKGFMYEPKQNFSTFSLSQHV